MGKVKDLTGQRFGRWTVIKFHEIAKHKAWWVCQCECGTVKNLSTRELTSGNSKSCGCLKRDKRVKDLTGQRFGRWLVLREAGVDKYGKVQWLCKCDCGNEKIVCGCSLRSGKSKSCGCLRDELLIKDLTGQNFCRLTVIERKGSDRHQNAIWLCKCECGNETMVSTHCLMSGSTKSCGCYHKDHAREMYTGKPRSEEIRKKVSNSLKGKYCGTKNPNWKGGITPITLYLREFSRNWFEECKKQVNYTCELTGKKDVTLHTHHLKGFNIIVLEAHETHNIEIKEFVVDYTEEELNLLKDYVASWHKDNSNAIVLSEDVHMLFHSLYGYGENTPEQFEEFKERYMTGEFKEILK